MKNDKEEIEEVMSNTDIPKENEEEKVSESTNPNETFENIIQESKTEDFSEEKDTKEIVEKEPKQTVLTKKNGIIFHIIAIICIALFAAAFAPKCLQNDTYYTITIGEYIYNNGISNLTEDIYSIHDIPYTYPHWLYDLGIFMIYNSFSNIKNK